jgi:carotenoid cleavage dioxygenase-like enzyme
VFSSSVAAPEEFVAAANSRFLEGAFAPVAEEVTAFDLPVTGRIPAELNGRYLRNGPNPRTLVRPGCHWFLGAGMVHGVRLRDGRAEWYRNRWVRSQRVAEALGEPWPGGPVHADGDFGANTHVIGHAGRILATVEAGALPYELSDELDTIGPCDFDGGLPGGFAAHTKADPRTGQLHAVAYSPGWKHVQHIAIDASGKVLRTVDIPLPHQPMMHDFALTGRYVVLYDLPVTLSMAAAAAGLRLPYTWNADVPARIGLLPRDGGADEIRWCEIEPCWVFHTLNAFEDERGRVVVDVCRYPQGYDVSVLAGGRGTVTLDRWTIDPVSGHVVETRLSDRGQEFPRTDERRAGRRHRYGYSVLTREVIAATGPRAGDPGDVGDEVLGNAVLKHDLASGVVEAHEFGAHAATGEAVFVACDEDAAEDEGYLLSFVHDPDRGASDLVILAAQDLAGGPVARIHLPARVPLGFHGSWIADR